MAAINAHKLAYISVVKHGVLINGRIFHCKNIFKHITLQIQMRFNRDSAEQKMIFDIKVNFNSRPKK